MSSPSTARRSIRAPPVTRGPSSSTMLRSRASEDGGVERRAARLQRFDDLIVLAVAELGPFGGERDDDRTHRLALLESLASLGNPVQHIGPGVVQRPDAIDALLEGGAAGTVVGEDGRPFADRDNRDLVFLPGRPV